jgi:Uma2 family endonuclease
VGGVEAVTYIPFDQYARHEQHQSWEWVNGVLDLLPPLSPEQSRVQVRLLETLGEYVEENGLGLVIPGPFAIRMPEEMRRGREPDVLFLPNQFVEAIHANYVNSHGVGLVVEIADADTRQRDRVDKFGDYQMAGIPEYWLLDVERRQAEFFVLHNDNQYHALEPDEQGVYHSRAVKGFELHLDSIW